MASKQLPGVEEIDIDLSKESVNYVPVMDFSHTVRKKNSSSIEEHEGTKIVHLIETVSKLKKEAESRTGTERELLAMKKENLTLSNNLETYKRQYLEHYNIAERLSKINKELERDNRKLTLLVKALGRELDEKNLVHNGEIGEERKRRERELTSAMEEHVNKEIELNSMIKALHDKVNSYSLELDKEKKNSMRKQEELKKKLSELL